MIEFPSGEVGAAHVPLLSLAVCRKNECAFARAYQNSNLAHERLLSAEDYLGKVVDCKWGSEQRFDPQAKLIELRSMDSRWRLSPPNRAARHRTCSCCTIVAGEHVTDSAVDIQDRNLKLTNLEKVLYP